MTSKVKYQDDDFTLKNSQEFSEKRGGTAHATKHLTPVTSTVHVYKTELRKKEI